IRYLLSPDQPMLACGMTTDAGRHVLVHCFLEVEGTLLQFRTSGYLLCPPESPHRAAVLNLLNDLNHNPRFVKFTLDPLGGEITVFSDLAILDSQATSSQIVGLISFFMERLREHSGRIEETIRTGVDPGGPFREEDEDADDVIR